MSDAPPKKRRNRSPSEPKPLYIFIQVNDDQGNPIKLEMDHVKLVAVERTAETAIKYMNNPKYPNTVCLQTMLAPTRTAQAMKEAAE